MREYVIASERQLLAEAVPLLDRFVGISLNGITVLTDLEVQR